MTPVGTDGAMRALRESAGLSRSEHIAVVRVEGPDAFEVVEYASTRRLYLREGQLRHTLLLDPDTGVFADVYIGSGDDGLFETGGHIGKSYAKVADTEAGVLKPLHGMQSWPVRVAYFPLLTKAETPEYEIAFRLFANGISGDLLLDYGDYAMKGILSRLDLLPGPGC